MSVQAPGHSAGTNAGQPTAEADVGKEPDSRNPRRVFGMFNRYVGVSIASFVCVLLLWEALPKLGIIDSVALVPPSDLAGAFVKLLEDGYAGVSLWGHFVASVLRALSGFALGAAVAIPVGLSMGMNRYARAIFEPFFALLRPIPAIAFIPLMILWLGIGELSKVLLISVASFLYVGIATTNGVASVPHDLQRVAINLGANSWQLFRYVVLPASLPSIFTGLKTGLGISWTVVVAAELIAAQRGLGFLIMDAATFYRIPVVYIGVILIGLVGLVLSLLLTGIEHKLVHWAGK